MTARSSLVWGFAYRTCPGEFIGVRTVRGMVKPTGQAP